MGNFNFKPLTFEEEEENFVVNWSGEQNKVDFFISNKYKNSFCVYYHHTMYYGEWGNIWEKPIVFMQMRSEKTKIKSKKPFKIKEIQNFFKKNQKMKMTIYFEPTILGDPETEEYFNYNNIWISSMGGLYHITDPGIALGDKKPLTYSHKEWNLGAKKIKINNYCLRDDYYKICEETAKTAKEMKINNTNWKIFYSKG